MKKIICIDDNNLMNKLFNKLFYDKDKYKIIPYNIINEKYEIKIGNNFINQEGSLSHFGNDFNLILRIYGPDLIYYDDPSLIPVAKILKGSCK